MFSPQYFSISITHTKLSHCKKKSIFDFSFFKVLIEAGADVNAVFESQQEKLEVEIDGKKKEINLKSYPGIIMVVCCNEEFQFRLKQSLEP